MEELDQWVSLKKNTHSIPDRININNQISITVLAVSNQRFSLEKKVTYLIHLNTNAGLLQREREMKNDRGKGKMVANRGYFLTFTSHNQNIN